MKILSIETSCDETAIAVLDINGPLEKPEIKVLGNTLLSQVALHEQYGGVYPNLAKREHQKNLPILLEQLFSDIHKNSELVGAPVERVKSDAILVDELSFIAVTSGPGLEPALWTGIEFAKALGEKWGKPVVPVNHMEGHIFSVLSPEENTELRLPALALLVSGGHTELVHVKDFGNYEILGRTVDDAAGEAYDKVARMLGLAYPGGPKISALAGKAREKNLASDFKFPRPMINSGDLNFSFSGLKTAVLYKLKDSGRDDEEFKEIIAKEFEDAVVEVLTDKTKRAIESLDNIKTLIVAGGVSANTTLRERFKELISEFPETVLQFPTKELSTDNAVMIGIAGYVKATTYPDILRSPTRLIAQGNLSISYQGE